MRFFAFVIIICASIHAISYDKHIEGKSLFTRHCLACHSSGGTAEQLDFTQLSRVAIVKDQLIAAINDNLMPPNVYDDNKDCLALRNKTEKLTSSEKQKLVSWLNSLNNKTEDIVLNQFSSRNDNDSTMLARKQKMNQLVLTKNDLIFLYKVNVDNDITSYYLINKDVPIPNSISEIAPDYNSRDSLHHIRLFYNDFKAGQIGSWIKYEKRPRFNSEKIDIKISKKRPLSLTTHRVYKTSLPDTDENFKISIYYRNKPGNSGYVNVSVPNIQLFNILNPSGKISYQFRNPTDHPLNIKMFIPHMHGLGRELLIEKLYHPPEMNKCVSHVIGYNHQVVKSYSFNKPMTLGKNEMLQITCIYKKSSNLVVLGMGINDEMCGVLFLVDAT